MKRISLILGMSVVMLASCSNKTADVALQEQPVQTEIKMRTIGGGGNAMAMPKATIFRMSGDYADRVAVTLNPDGTLAYYPAVTDIMTNSAPYDLGNGWWLNRQGLSSNSVFTKWTFDEYSKLKSTPSREEIIEAIIPGARVTAMEQLPITISEAMRNPSQCKQYVPK